MPPDPPGEGVLKHTLRINDLLHSSPPKPKILYEPLINTLMVHNCINTSAHVALKGLMTFTCTFHLHRAPIILAVSLLQLYQVSS